MENYRELLRLIAGEDLIPNVPPIQLGIRLLLPEGSRLMELPEVRAIAQGFDRRRLVYPWKHPDPAMDRLSQDVQDLAKTKLSREEMFTRIWDLANCGTLDAPRADRATIPYLTEPWYC
jgi:hypothetical protein